MATPRNTGYGWKMRVANGRIIEFATEDEANHYNDDDNKEEAQEDEVL